MDAPPIVNDFAAIIQTSLAPVFLLAGTAGFVNIFATRLGRVSDRLNEVAERNGESQALRMQLAYGHGLLFSVQFRVWAGVCSDAPAFSAAACKRLSLVHKAIR
jgi:hypothetical protein